MPSRAHRQLQKMLRIMRNHWYQIFRLHVGEAHFMQVPMPFFVLENGSASKFTFASPQKRPLIQGVLAFIHALSAAGFFPIKTLGEGMRNWNALKKDGSVILTPLFRLKRVLSALTVMRKSRIWITFTLNTPSTSSQARVAEDHWVKGYFPGEIDLWIISQRPIQASRLKYFQK